METKERREEYQEGRDTGRESLNQGAYEAEHGNAIQ